MLFTDDERGGMLPEWAMNSSVVLLTLVSELLAFTAVGSVARWGEVFPRRTPWLRGRRVPTAVVVAPGAIGATILTLVFTVAAAVSEITDTKTNGDPLPEDFPSEVGGWHTFYYYLSYVPLVLWGPMLALLTYAYWRRRRAVTSGPLVPSTAG
ncbi:hypothetical protein [Streptomyces pratensis]|uniref:hypothetical protein n=1 Tax=Streptomyces pratensis TaxID=1169025 RepID=UPI003638677C